VAVALVPRAVPGRVVWSLVGSTRSAKEVFVAESVEVARVDDVPPGTARVVTVGNVELALVDVDGQFYAIDNECTHLGGYLGEGEINPDWSEWAIECPLHASVFDVRTGEVLNRPATEPVRTYAVEVEAGVVKVSIA
jgi:3-phenylpropionate/trans-cinnamate dioxygenase ferredoxin component